MQDQDKINEKDNAVERDLKPVKKGDRDDQLHTMSEEELLDETIDDSFPASDPPGHYSKSTEDKELH